MNKKDKKQKDYYFNFGVLFLGLSLIVLGFLYLAHNAGWLVIDIELRKLWPLVLVFAGLSMLRLRGWAGAIIGTLITILAVGLLAFTALAEVC